MQIIKVQMPIDQARAQREGLAFVDKDNPDMLLYGKGQSNAVHSRDAKLRKMMLDAENGVGYLKAFVYAEWRQVPRRWEIDYERGFAPMQNW